MLLQEVVLDGDTRLYKIPENFYTISSGIFGGYGKYEAIILKRVPNTFNVENVYEWCSIEILKKYGVESKCIVLLTSVDINNRIRIVDYIHEHTVDIIITAGFSPVSCIEYERTFTPLHGTINIIVCTNLKLKPQGLVDLYRTIVEAKTIAIADTLLECNSRPTGTITDTVTISALANENGYITCGLATTVGNKIAKIIYETIIQEYSKHELSKYRDLEEVICEIIRRELRYRRKIIEKVIENSWRPRRDLNPGPTA